MRDGQPLSRRKFTFPLYAPYVRVLEEIVQFCIRPCYAGYLRIPGQSAALQCTSTYNVSCRWWRRDSDGRRPALGDAPVRYKSTRSLSYFLIYFQSIFQAFTNRLLLHVQCACNYLPSTHQSYDKFSTSNRDKSRFQLSLGRLASLWMVLLTIHMHDR